MKRIQITAAAATVYAVLICGCSKSVSDDALTTDIKAKLYSDPTTKPADVSVAVKSGVVTLTGDVPSSDVELEAMKVANSTAGVKSVNDQLTVNGAAAANQLPNAGNTTAAAPAPQASAPANNPYPQPALAAPPLGAPPPPPMASGPPPIEAGPVPRPEPAPSAAIIPAGEQVSVRTIQTIDSDHNESGQTFGGTLSAPLVSRGRVVVPAGTRVRLLLASARDSGRIKGRPELEIRLNGLEFQGRRYPVESSVFAETGASRGKQTAVRTGIGAAAGALIGALAGGGKGAAIGSAAGGGAGIGSDLFTHGPHVKIPSESILTFRLEAPLRLEP